MSEMNGEFPTVLGQDARFKGELTFDKGLRILGTFDGQIKSKGSLHVAEGSHVTAQIEAASVRVDGEVKGNIVCSEKLHLSATSRIDGDLRTARLEMNDGAQFTGHVAVGAKANEAGPRRESAAPMGNVRPVDTGAPRNRPSATPEPAALSIPGVGAGR